jgi:hypothetical protein
LGQVLSEFRAEAVPLLIIDPQQGQFATIGSDEQMFGAK